jgi:hypothetical protein
MATTTSIFRLNFESYPELRTELRAKAASKVFDQMSVAQRDGDGTDSCKLTRETWVKDTLAEWDEVDADYVPEEHAEFVQMTDAQRARKIVAFEKRATAGAAKLAAKAAKKLAKTEAMAAKKLAKTEAKAAKKLAKAEAKATKAAEKEELKAARAVVKAEAKAIYAIKAAEKQANMTQTTVSHGIGDSMDGGDSSESELELELEPESEVDELVFEMNYLAVTDVDESTVVPVVPTTTTDTAVPSMSKSEKKDARIAERAEKLIARTELKEARDAQKEVVRRAKSDAKLAKASAKQRQVKPTDANNNAEDDIDVYNCARRAAAGVCVSDIGAPSRRQLASRYLSARACVDVTARSVNVDDFMAANDGVEIWTDMMIADWNVTGAKFVPAPYHTYLD